MRDAGTGARPEGEAAPLRVHGAEVSYFTGKLEGYLRYKGIPYERVAATPRAVRKHTGVAQIPAVELADGRWLTDTTRIIEWFEAGIPEPQVVPRDPLQAFVSRLLEDYGDEWLWRPAMHYRWSYQPDALLLSGKIARELASDVPAPAFVKRLLVRARQRLLFTRGDGVRAATRAHIEATYLGTLGRMQAILAARPFLLGGAPSLVDFGFFGSMFRHFGMDPTPSTIMRETAPEVYAWVARVWNARAGRCEGGLEAGIPEEWGPVLSEIGATHLQHLAANAEAWKTRRKRFHVEIQGVWYRGLRTARYRVACLEALRRDYEALPEAAQSDARALLERHGCWEPLWRVDAPPSGLEGMDPFASGLSMTGLGG
jgi:glutathione S-transferase